MPLDVSQDYLMFDWLQDITYYVRQDETNYATGISITNCLKREDHKTTESVGFADLKNHEVIWEVWVHGMETVVVPKRGDKLTATVVSGVQSFEVEKVDYCDKTTRYRLHTYQLGKGA